LRQVVCVSDVPEELQRPRRAPRGRRRALGLTASVLAHAAIFLAVASAWKNPPQAFEMQPIAVALVQETPPPPPPPPPEPPKPSAPRAPRHVAVAKPPAAHNIRVRRTVAAPPDVAPLQIAAARTAERGDELSEAQIAGASSGGDGGIGGSGHGCNMAGRLQGALRRDQLVQAAVATLQGKAVMVWNGDWVQHEGEDGRGLAAVREAIMWEVAFAPAACRAEPVHGLVLLSLNSRAGGTRLAVGSGEWRWSDLLGARSNR
jgi:hypothetical protein